VSRWIGAVRRGGEAALRAKPRPGRPSKLDAARRRRLLRELERGPEKHGYATQLWTAERIRKLILERFGVVFHVNHVPKLLRDCGWSYQRPTSRATERDEAAIATWLKEDWPRIKKKRAANERR
jgi:putative transposase